MVQAAVVLHCNALAVQTNSIAMMRVTVLTIKILWAGTCEYWQ